MQFAYLSYNLFHEILGRMQCIFLSESDTGVSRGRVLPTRLLAMIDSTEVTDSIAEGHDMDPESFC
jgi:hypothetical protein